MEGYLSKKVRRGGRNKDTVKRYKFLIRRVGGGEGRWELDC